MYRNSHCWAAFSPTFSFRQLLCHVHRVLWTFYIQLSVYIKTDYEISLMHRQREIETPDSISICNLYTYITTGNVYNIRKIFPFSASMRVLPFAFYMAQVSLTSIPNLVLLYIVYALPVYAAEVTHMSCLCLWFSMNVDFLHCVIYMSVYSIIHYPAS